MLHEKTTLSHGSLFSGVGGFDLGFERAGFKTIWQVEIDVYARRVLDRQFPSVPKYEDIATVGRHNLATPTVISGGFPCQDISCVGTGEGLDGHHSGLWKEMLRVVDELRPQFVVVENTSALLFRGIGRVLGDLYTVGYDAEWEVISAASMDAPHKRERCFVVAYPQNQPGLQTRSVFDSAGIVPETRTHNMRVHWQAMASANWKIPKSYTVRAIDGIPRRMERAKALGNAVIPQIAEELAWMIRRASET